MFILAALSAAMAVQAQPTFTATFTPDSIGSGSTSTLTFTITNASGSPVSDLAFTNTLPAGVTIASPAQASASCLGGTLSAPNGGVTITYSGGAVGANSSCTIKVNVTSATPGVHMNVSGDLTSSAGNSGPASDDLTVATNRPGFTKSFTPSTITFGQRSTLTLTIDNSLNAGTAFSLAFNDTLPTGMVIASPANVIDTCTGGNLTAIPGTGSISYDSGTISAGSVCTISLDVVGNAAGLLGNVSGDLTSFDIGFSTRNSGKASAVLDVSLPDDILLVKSFIDDPIPPGGTGTLRFTITNRNRTEPLDNIAFMDDLDATLSGLMAIGLPADGFCGSGAQITGMGILSMTGGDLGPGASCFFDVTVQVPAGATPGIYTNDTTAVTGDVGGTGVTGNVASDDLFVEAAPVITKSFTDDPVAAGDTVTLEFTITNTSATSGATDIAFTDELTAFLPFPVSVTLPPPGFCGPGSTMTLIVPDIDRHALSMTGGSLAPAGMPGDSCTFFVTIDIPPLFPNGNYTNTTSSITATVDGMTVTGTPATDVLQVVAPPTLSKAIIGNPVVPGGTYTIEYTLVHDADAPTDATNISFSDDLNAVIAGMASISPVQNNICGTGSQVSGAGVVNFTGGTLAPGDMCTISVDVMVPAGTPSATYPSPTGPVMADVGGMTLTGNSATDDLIVAEVTFTKSFIDDPGIAGGMVTLRFTLTNNSTTLTADNILFTDNFDAVITGMAAVAPLPTPSCGGTLSGTTFLIYSGGSLAPLEICTFDVTLQVPLGTAAGSYLNATSNLFATIGGSPINLPPATDVLEIIDPLSITKSFTDDPVLPGGMVTLEYTVFNLDPNNTATDVSFTDDLNAALTGLAATVLPPVGICGATSQMTGAGVLTFSMGTIGPSGMCVIPVTLQVPAGATPGTFVTSTSGPVTGTVSGVMVTGDTATDNLQIGGLEFTKAFSADTAPTGTVTLTFTLTNPDAVNPVTDIRFSDDLGALIPGMAATGLPANLCGGTVSGTNIIDFMGGTLGPGETCMIPVTVQIPGTAMPGTYINTTSVLDSSVGNISPASAPLVVNPSPAFSKNFAPNPIIEGGVSTLTFTIDNSGSTIAANNLDFTDMLPAGLVVAPTPNATTDCTGGTLTANAGAGVISYTGGTVPAGVVCTVSVDVTAAVGGDYPNTSGNLTSSSGDSGTAIDTLRVNPPPAFSKTFAPNPIIFNGISTLTFTVDNSGSTVDATSLDFTDMLPAGVVIAGTPNAMTDCTGGTLTAMAGGTTIMYTGGTVSAGAVCTVTVDVTSSTAGSHVNTSGDLTSSLGNSGPATDTLRVNPPPGFSKSFAPNPIAINGISTLTFTIDNSGSTVDATGLDFTDMLPAGVVIAGTPNAMTDCTGGTLTAMAGGTTIMYTGGTVSAGAVCTVVVDVTSAAAGDYPNTSGDLTSSLGNSGPANDSLRVNPPPLFSKSFAPNPIFEGGVSTLTFTIDNSGSTAAATGLDFTDILPAGLVIAATPNTMTDCTGGAITAPAGGGSVSYSGGTVAAGAVCTVAVDVTSGSAGDYANTSGSLTSSLGDSGTASDSLRVNPLKTFTKVFSPASILPGEVSTLTFTIDNTGSTADATNVTFTDNLPAGVVIAAIPNSSTTCMGGTLTAPAGGMTIDYSGGTVPAGAMCTVSVDVTSNVPGTHTNISGDLMTSAGNGGSATADLEVQEAADLVIAKSDNPDPVPAGAQLVYTVTVTNNGPSDALDVVVTDTLPGAVTLDSTAGCAEDPNGVPTCTLGTVTANTSVQITYTVTVDSGATGTLSNMVDVTSSTTELNPGDESAVEDTTIVLEADLAIDLTGPANANPGQPLNLTVTVTNNGPSDALGSDVSASFPAELSGVTWTCAASAGSSCAAGGSGDIADTADVLAGGTLTYAVTGTVDPNYLGDLTSTGQVTPAAGVTDNVPGNNNDTLSLDSISPADITGSMAVQGTPQEGGGASLIVREGESVFYQVILFNNSAFAQFDDPASDEFINTLPPGLTLVGATSISGGGTLDINIPGNTVTWNGTIPGTSMVEFEIEATVDPGTGGMLLSNQGQINYDADGDGVNESQTVTDDPDLPGAVDPTIIRVLMPVPTLSPLGLVIFILGLGLAAFFLRKRVA